MTSLGPSTYDIFPVWDDLNVIYQSSKVTDIKKDAKHAHFGEQHNRYRVQADHSQAIDEMVIPGSILLVEGFKALVEVTGENRDRILRMLHISKYAQEMLTVIGWDQFNHMKEQRDTVYVCKLDPKTGDSSVFIEEESIFPLADKLSLLEEVESGFNDELDKENLPENFKALVEQIIPVTKSVTEKARKEYHEQIAETFPDRTKAMVYTLREMENRRLKGEITGNIFLVGGLYHLRERAGCSDPRYSLKPLYELLEELPAVGLSSKVIDTERSKFEL